MKALLPLLVLTTLVSGCASLETVKEQPIMTIQFSTQDASKTLYTITEAGNIQRHYSTCESKNMTPKVDGFVHILDNKNWSTLASVTDPDGIRSLEVQTKARNVEFKAQLAGHRDMLRLETLNSGEHTARLSFDDDIKSPVAAIRARVDELTGPHTWTFVGVGQSDTGAATGVKETVTIGLVNELCQVSR